MTGRSRFRHTFEVLFDPGRPIPELDMAALSLACRDYQQLNYGYYLHRLDLMAGQVIEAAGRDAAPGLLRNRLFWYVFDEQEFRCTGGECQAEDYHLHQLLDQHQGSAEALGVLCLELGRRVGLLLDGVDFPATLLVSCWDDGQRVFHEPGRNGLRVNMDYLHRLQNTTFEGWLEVHRAMLQPAGTIAIISRMLRNMIALHARQQNWFQAAGCLERLLLLYPRLDSPWQHEIPFIRQMTRLWDQFLFSLVPDDQPWESEEMLLRHCLAMFLERAGEREA